MRRGQKKEELGALNWFHFTNKNPQDAPRLQERAKTLVSQLIGATEQRNGEVEEELSLALSAEETLEEDDLQEDLPLPDPAEPLKDKNHVVVPAKRNHKLPMCAMRRAEARGSEEFLQSICNEQFVQFDSI